eukprot:2770651-Rhodomonas_salina.1
MHLHRRWKRALTLHRVAEVSNEPRHLRDGIVHCVLCSMQVPPWLRDTIAAVGKQKLRGETAIGLPACYAMPGTEVRARCYQGPAPPGCLPKHLNREQLHEINFKFGSTPFLDTSCDADPCRGLRGHRVYMAQISLCAHAATACTCRESGEPQELEEASV